MIVSATVFWGIIIITGTIEHTAAGEPKAAALIPRKLISGRGKKKAIKLSVQ